MHYPEKIEVHEMNHLISFWYYVHGMVENGPFKDMEHVFIRQRRPLFVWLRDKFGSVLGGWCVSWGSIENIKNHLHNCTNCFYWSTYYVRRHSSRKGRSIKVNNLCWGWFSTKRRQQLWFALKRCPFKNDSKKQFSAYIGKDKKGSCHPWESRICICYKICITHITIWILKKVTSLY